MPYKKESTTKELNTALEPFRDRYKTARNEWEKKGIRLEVRIFKREWKKNKKKFKTEKVFDEMAEGVFT